jgi:hypothetical protein
LAALLAAWGALARVVQVLPVLLAAALPLAVAAVSGLAKRPRSGLALTQRTRPRSSCSEEDELQPGRSVVRESAYQERHSCWPAGVECSCVTAGSRERSWRVARTRPGWPGRRTGGCLRDLAESAQRRRKRLHLFTESPSRFCMDSPAGEPGRCGYAVLASRIQAATRRAGPTRASRDGIRGQGQLHRVQFRCCNCSVRAHS